MCKLGKCQCSDGKDMTITDDGRFCLRKRERLLGQSCNSYTNTCFHPTGEIWLIFCQTLHFWLVYVVQKVPSVYSFGCKGHIFVRRIGNFLCRFIFTVNVSIMLYHITVTGYDAQMVECIDGTCKCSPGYKQQGGKCRRCKKLNLLDIDVKKLPMYSVKFENIA